mgnify:CR=1 FL=1
MDMLDRNMIHAIASYLKIPEATALRWVSRTFYEAEPLRAVSRITLTTGLNTILAEELGNLEAVDVEGIPSPLVMRKLGKALQKVKRISFAAHARIPQEVLAIQGLPSLQEFRGHVSSNADAFIGTLVADSPDIRVLEINFTSTNGAKSLALIPDKVWPNLRRIVIRGGFARVPIPWRNTLEHVEYYGACESKWTGYMPLLKELIMHDDTIDDAGRLRDLPVLRHLGTNVYGMNLRAVLFELGADTLRSLQLRVIGPAPENVTSLFSCLNRLVGLKVTGFVFNDLGSLTNKLEVLDVFCTWKAVGTLVRAIREGNYKKLRRLNLVFTADDDDDPCINALVEAAEALDSLKELKVVPFHKRKTSVRYTAGAKRRSKQFSYRRRAATKTIHLEI